MTNPLYYVLTLSLFLSLSTLAQGIEAKTMSITSRSKKIDKNTQPCYLSADRS